ncbi:MAG: hypothetical protein AAFZ15_15450 [Bacteroidota bacterium]
MFDKMAPQSAYRPLGAVWGQRGQLFGNRGIFNGFQTTASLNPSSARRCGAAIRATAIHTQGCPHVYQSVQVEG